MRRSPELPGGCPTRLGGFSKLAGSLVGQGWDSSELPDRRSAQRGSGLGALHARGRQAAIRQQTTQIVPVVEEVFYPHIQCLPTRDGDHLELVGESGQIRTVVVSGNGLIRTKLVVLSACQTGMGDVKAGDGVYGLRRALVLAGAETQVMSLWPVDESATTELMKSYYNSLSKGGGRSEALRQVQLAMLHDARWEHPYYWAGFLVSGADGALDDTAVAPDLRVHGLRGCACDLTSSPGEDRSPAGLVIALGALLLAARRRRANHQAPAR